MNSLIVMLTIAVASILLVVFLFRPKEKKLDIDELLDGYDVYDYRDWELLGGYVTGFRCPKCDRINMGLEDGESTQCRKCLRRWSRYGQSLVSMKGKN